jgi:glycosyltransferase involved in cell wall biosynthesis
VWYKTAKAARAAGVGMLVHTDHGRRVPDPWPGRVSDRLASRRTDVVVAVSEPLRERLTSVIGIDAKRIRTILNGVDVERFRPGSVDQSLYARLGVSPDTPLIGSLGRFDPVKRYDLMIDAFHRLRSSWTEQDGTPPVLVIAGDGPDRPALDRALAATPFAADVKLPGWVSNASDLYRALTVFSLSSSSEGTSMSLLEAMSSGVAPVVTDVGGNGAVLGSGLAHQLVPFGEPGAMAGSWATLLKNTQIRDADSSAARARVESTFSLDTMVRAYENLYSEARTR